MRNLKLAFRSLARTPFVTAVAVLSLALGIGANAAIYSLFDQMLLRPLPVQEPTRLVNLGAPGPKPGSQSCGQAGDCEQVFSYPMLRDLEREQTVFTGIAAHSGFGVNLAYQGQVLNGQATFVSGSYFPVLGLQPAAGRLIGPSDDEVVGAHSVAVLSHSYWTTYLNADPGVVGQAITINGQPMTVIGIAPEGFEGTTLGWAPRVFVPISMRTMMNPGFDGFENRRDYWIYLFGRLKPGVTLEQATTGINASYRPIITEVEAPIQSTELSPATLERFRNKLMTVAEGRRGQSSVHEEARTPLLLLFATTGVVLLIACANVANLLLARGATRSAEMAVRLALGASRRQLLGQLLTEALVLAALGGVVSLIIARATLALIASIMPGDAIATLVLELRPEVVVFAAALAIGTGLIFGMFPALHSTRPDLISTIRANTGQLSGARTATRFRTSLVTVQIALSMALLVTAGLFLKSLTNVSRIDLGLNAENVVTFRISPTLNGYDSTRTMALFERVEQELSALPGVTSVSAGQVALLAGNNWGTDVSVQGFVREPDTDANSRTNAVAPGYFRTLDMPLLAGRDFTASDVGGSGRVAIINQTFARKFNLGAEPVGKFMGDGGTDDEMDIQIVGLVRDAKYSEVKDTIPPLFVVPYRQRERIGALTFYVRTTLAPEPMIATIASVVQRIDPDLPLQSLKTLPQQVRENIFLDRMISTLSASFATLATVLAAIGLYGVLAYTVAQRTREIGVRMALGADAGRVRTMVLMQVGRMALVGGLIGIAAALALGRAAQSLLFGLEGHDPLVVGASVLILTLVALGAAYGPARRASMIQPMRALRYE